MSMATTQDLRKDLQAFKYEGRERPWGYFSFQRWPSIYFTKLAIKYNLKPNQITLAGIGLGVIGSILVLLSPPLKILGAFFLYLNIISDKVDGEVARYRIKNNLGGVYIRGVYLDELNHLIIPPLFIMGVSLGIIYSFPYNTSFLYLMALSASLSFPILRVYHSFAPQIFMKKYVKHPELFASLPSSEKAEPIAEIKKRHGFIRRMSWVVHQLQDFFVIVFLFFLAFILEWASPLFWPSLLSGLLLVILGIILPLIVLENSVKGFFAIEYRIRDVKKRLKDKYIKNI